jgi:hypothetical protein
MYLGALYLVLYLVSVRQSSTGAPGCGWSDVRPEHARPTPKVVGGLRMRPSGRQVASSGGPPARFTSRQGASGPIQNLISPGGDGHLAIAGRP